MHALANNSGLCENFFAYFLKIALSCPQDKPGVSSNGKSFYNLFANAFQFSTEMLIVNGGDAQNAKNLGIPGGLIIYSLFIPFLSLTFYFTLSLHFSPGLQSALQSAFYSDCFH